MKRRCPFCAEQIKGKRLQKHIFEEHEGRGNVFYCREDCVRCCTDKGAPLELLLSDIEILSHHLQMSKADFFQEYGGILWTNIPTTRLLIPSTGLPFPCKFLKDAKCTVYEERPLHCRLFPERLYMSPTPQSFEPFTHSEYKCVDEGIHLDDDRRNELEQLMKRDEEELRRTAAFFKNEDHMYELGPDQYTEIHRYFEGLDRLDPERNRLKRAALEKAIPEEHKKKTLEAFIQALRK